METVVGRLLGWVGVAPKDMPGFPAPETDRPLSLLSTTRDTTLNDYYIPKKCCVFINQWQVNHDQ